MQAIVSEVETKNLNIDEPLILEGGEILPQVSIKYSIIGTLNEAKSNVVWIFHALTGNSDPTTWWSGLIGEDCAFNPEKDFIICANVIGSCYGSTGPENFSFPFITIRDMVKAHQLLRDHLSIASVKLGIGGSLGGQQLLEWAVQEPEFFENIIPIATNAQHSAWGIAFNEAQRMALQNKDLEKGLETARAIAMMSYRSYGAFSNAQQDYDQRWDHFSASSYINYQGKKLRKRFTPYSYYVLSKAMDSHNISRRYYTIENALSRIQSNTLIIGIDSDVLFPAEEQQQLHQGINGSKLEILNSIYGHDAFLIETEKINANIKEFLK